MKKLELPIIKRKTFIERHLNMEDYLEFVTLNLKLFPFASKQKKFYVNKTFFIK